MQFAVEPTACLQNNLACVWHPEVMYNSRVTGTVGDANTTPEIQFHFWRQ